MTGILGRFSLAGLLLAAPAALSQGAPLPPIGTATPAAFAAPPARKGEEALPPPMAEPPVAYDLAGLTETTLRANPRLAQAAYAIDVAAGRALQAGLKPNPVLSFTADELGDRAGPGGILTAAVSQEIVTAGKLQLAREAALREADQATLSLLSTRYSRLGAVRSAYYEALALQRRAQVLDEVLRLAVESLRLSERLLKAGQASELDLVQLQVEYERLRAEREAVLREIPAAFRRLAAAVGVTGLPEGRLGGSIDVATPAYDLEAARVFVGQSHPDVLSARKGVDRAQALLARAIVEPVPNVTVQAGYVRQNQNRSTDWMVGLSLPVPVWNRNQGGILAAKAQVGESIQAVGRAENEVVERLATAYGTYASARRRAELYRSSLLPRARKSYELAAKGYRAGNFDYLRVLEAQRAYSQAELEAVRSSGEAWRSAAELSGLLLEDFWPEKPPMPPGPLPAPCGPTIEIIPAPRPAPGALPR
ncbi:MAG: TolC family protein [Gemmataceae bacterium]|nr:TolC family protein [Gemmataceae bacterium]